MWAGIGMKLNAGERDRMNETKTYCSCTSAEVPTIAKDLEFRKNFAYGNGTRKILSYIRIHKVMETKYRNSQSAEKTVRMSEVEINIHLYTLQPTAVAVSDISTAKKSLKQR